MIALRKIRELAEQIGRRFKPTRIILFGSHAYGRPTPDSDVDLLVIMPCRGSTLDKEFEIRQAIHARFPLDLLVRTPAEISRRLAWNDFFIKEIVNRGKLLYEAPDAGMGKEGGGGLSERAARAAGQKRAKPRRRVLPRAAVR